MYIHAKICGYGWEISYPRQASESRLCAEGADVGGMCGKNVALRLSADISFTVYPSLFIFLISKW